MQLACILRKGTLGAFFFLWACAFANPIASSVNNSSNSIATKSITPHHHKTPTTHKTTKPVHHKKTVHHYHYVPTPSLPADFVTPTDLSTNQDSVCTNAEAELGKRYVWGGASPKGGFDCSGFSQYVYKKEGIDIPRTALQQYDSLPAVKTPEPGDLVFFHTHGRTVSHVGIYLGDGYFIHSPRTGQRIRVDNLNSGYWQQHYSGARRALSWNYADDEFAKDTLFDSNT